MMKQITFVAVLLCAASSSQAADLLNVYELARNNDPQFRADTANYYASQQLSPQRRAQLLPQINGGISSTETDSEVKNRNDPFSVSGESSTDAYFIRLSQSLYNHGYWQQLKQANLLVAQAEANYEAAKENLLLRTAQTYFELLASNDNLKFAEAETRAVEQQLEQAKQRFEVGLIAITDVKESQAEYDQAIAAEIIARNTLSSAREALWALTNTDVEFLTPLGETLPLQSPEPDDKQQWVDLALNQNRALIGAGFARDAAYKEVSIQRSGHYPNLSVVAQRQHGDVTYDDPLIDLVRGGEQTNDSIALELSIPIFSGGGTHARVKEAVYRRDAARDQYELIRRSTVQQTRNAFQNTVAGISRVKALKQALVSSQAAYEATEAGFEVGTRNSVEVLLSLRNTFRAERDYARARYDYLLDTLELKQAVGNLTTADLEAINRWLAK